MSKNQKASEPKLTFNKIQFARLQAALEGKRLGLNKFIELCDTLVRVIVLCKNEKTDEVKKLDADLELVMETYNHRYGQRSSKGGKSARQSASSKLLPNDMKKFNHKEK
jgi:hypothetical protein